LFNKTESAARNVFDVRSAALGPHTQRLRLIRSGDSVRGECPNSIVGPAIQRVHGRLRANKPKALSAQLARPITRSAREGGARSFVGRQNSTLPQLHSLYLLGNLRDESVQRCSLLDCSVSRCAFLQSLGSLWILLHSPALLCIVLDRSVGSWTNLHHSRNSSLQAGSKKTGAAKKSWLV
jgi:hypothetical protein